MRLILITLLSFFALSLSAQGINFFEGTWNEAVAEAKKQEKIIFVDAYATWCGPCKIMSKNVFTDQSVGDFYNKNFINVKLDMERGEGISFRQNYPVSAFPTLFYIDFNGEVLQKIRGALMSPEFIKAGKAALGKLDRSGKFAEAYEKGDRSPELIHSYIQALNQAGKPSLKITNEYLRSQKNLATKENYQIIYEGAVEADSKVFELLIQYRRPIEAIYSKQLVEERVINACQTTANNAIEYRSQRILDEAIDKAIKYAPSYGKSFAAQAKMKYFKETGDANSFVKACESYCKTLEKEDRQTHFLVANELAKVFGKNANAMKLSEKLAKQAAEGSENYNFFLGYSNILLMNGKKAKAREAAETAQALVMASDNSSAKMAVSKYMERFK